MAGGAASLAQRLATVTAGFFEARLGLNPRVRVLEEGEDLIVIKVQGFRSRADVMLVEHLKDQKTSVLGAHHARVFERLCPMLSVVVEEVAKRPLVGCRAEVDLFRDECLYLLYLGTREQRENTALQTPEERG